MILAQQAVVIQDMAQRAYVVSTASKLSTFSSVSLTNTGIKFRLYLCSRKYVMGYMSVFLCTVGIYIFSTAILTAERVYFFRENL